MIIGIPKETLHGERRVAGTPTTISKMVAQGLTVLVETGAGIGSYFDDKAYKEAGARIIENVEDLFAQADVILKVKQPVFNEAKRKHEVDMMHKGQILVTFLHPASPGNHDMVRRLAANGVTALTLDSVPRITRAQAMDALTSMSTVAGYKAALMAADRLPEFVPMIGSAVGMIKPATALIIGSGVAGLQAIATAKRLGAVVYAADIRPAAREQAMSLGAKIVELGIPEELAAGEGGYARTLPEEWLAKEREALCDVVAKADIVILTALIPGRRAPILLTGKMVDSMRPGAAIMDVAIDQGGNCELTQPGEVVTRGTVSIDGTPNIPGMVPMTATHMFAENILNYLSLLVKDGKLDINLSDEIIAACLVTWEGSVVHAGALEAMASP